MTTSYRAMFDLSGRCAVVTGGAGILGRRFCAALAEFGASVAVVDVDEAAAGEVAGSLAAKGARAIAVACDVSEPESVQRMVMRATAEIGPIDILLNNAASKSEDLDAFFAPAERYDIAEWRRVMAVNLDGMMLVAQAVGAQMKERGRGSIVQTSSIYGIMAPDQRIYEGSEYMGRAINTPPVYAVSKAGVIGLTRYLATYWAPCGIRVNSITPGGVESGQNTEFRRRYSARVPLGRMARADELAGAVVYLASDASSYVTGHNLVVDGGLSVW